MMKKIWLAAAAAALSGPAIAGGAATISARASETLSAYEPTGEKVECLSTTQRISIEAVSETTFLVRSGGDYYLNHVRGKCSGATRNDVTLIFSLTKPQLCRLDTVIVEESVGNILRGSCSLGSFEKLAQKAPA